MTAPFAAFVALAANLLEQRTAIVERLESGVLNVKSKPLARERDPRAIAALIDAAIFAAPGVQRDAARVRDDLRSAHLADGFEPLLPQTYVPPLDPAMLVVRAYEAWDAQRWPGFSARLAYARSLYDACMLRLLEGMALRVWDEGEAEAGERVEALQRLLDRLNGAPHGGAMIRDARWLLQTAQGAITKHLAPYFRVAAHIADSLHGVDSEAVHGAGAMLGGGHLRSQWRQRAMESTLDAAHPDILATTRNSNALDVALIVWDLVPLLDAYVAAVVTNDRASRRRLAGAILQGWSADPELLLTRLDLLSPSTMIETLFVEADNAGGHRYSEIGERHRRMLARYAELVDRAAPSMLEDAPASDPKTLAYSPFGLVYGFCADLLSRLALASLYGRPARAVALEDFFIADGCTVSAPAAPDRIDYSPDWAEEIFARTSDALRRRAAHAGRANASDRRTASLIVVSHRPDDARRSAQEHCVTSDVALALASGASAFPRSQVLADRLEARFLASAETGGRWFGVSKVILTLRLAQGEDAVVSGLPDAVSDILRLTCPDLVSWRREAD